MPEVISNTTPFQYLHQVGLLELLPRFYQRVVLPHRVVLELEAGCAQGVDLPEVKKLSWIELRSAPPSTWPLPPDIHAGEAEVLALASAANDPLLLLDDGAARRYARALGLSFTGTLGILLEPRRKESSPLCFRFSTNSSHAAFVSRQSLGLRCCASLENRRPE